MRYIDIDKKRPARWPWLLGLVVLALLGWGVTVLLAPPERPGPTTVADTVEGGMTPAAIPAAPNLQSSPAVRPMTDLAPIGPDDLGQSVRASGQVVTSDDDSFWLATGSSLVRVESRRRPREGDSISVDGTLQRSVGSGADDRPDPASGPDGSDRWTVVTDVMLVDAASPASDADSAP